MWQCPAKDRSDPSIPAARATGFAVGCLLAICGLWAIVSGPTVFASLPERVRELDFVQTKYPNGQRTNVSRYGADLYAAHRINP